MKHLKKGRKLGRTSSHRRALLCNLSEQLFRYGRIITTTSRCKELRRLAERLITYAKRNTLHTRRLAKRYLKNKEVCKKLFEIIGPRFSERQGGYTKIIKAGRRVGDGAPLAIIELVE